MITPTMLRTFGSMSGKPTREICHETADLIEAQAAQIAVCEANTNRFIEADKAMQKQLAAQAAQIETLKIVIKDALWDETWWCVTATEALAIQPDDALAAVVERVKKACIDVLNSTKWSNWYQSDCIEAIRTLEIKL